MLPLAKFSVAVIMHATNSNLADVPEAELKTSKAQRIRTEQGLDRTFKHCSQSSSQ